MLLVYHMTESQQTNRRHRAEAKGIRIMVGSADQCGEQITGTAAEGPCQG